MQVIPRTHAGYPEMEKMSTGENDLLGLTVDVTKQMEADAVPLEMAAGSLSIHDSFIVHGSHANSSDRRRAAYTMRYANTKTVKVNSDEHWVAVYHVRGQLPSGCVSEYVDIRK